jgi:alpha-galactosidase
MLLQHRQVRPYYSGDYYPLTPYSKADDVWMAYQLHRDDLNEGMVVAFRRPNAPDAALTFKLRGLEPGARYVLLFVDSGERKEVTGSELMDKGLTVELPNPRSSALITYRPG